MRTSPHYTNVYNNGKEDNALVIIIVSSTFVPCFASVFWKRLGEAIQMTHRQTTFAEQEPPTNIPNLSYFCCLDKYQNYSLLFILKNLFVSSKFGDFFGK